MENIFWKCIGALYAAEQELVFKCNKKVGVIFPPEKFKQSNTNWFLEWQHKCENWVRWPSQIHWCSTSCIIDGRHLKSSDIILVCSKQAQKYFCSLLYFSEKQSVCACCMLILFTFATPHFLCAIGHCMSQSCNSHTKLLPLHILIKS